MNHPLMQSLGRTLQILSTNLGQPDAGEGTTVLAEAPSVPLSRLDH